MRYMQSRVGVPGNAGPSIRSQMEIQSGEYSWEWAELRKLRRRFLIAGTGAIVVFGLLWNVVNSVWAMVLLSLGWVVAIVTLFLTLMKIAYWLCPRCGKEFHGRRGTFNRLSNPLARRCAHCGLPKWADPDPDPKLKRELYPFRTDQIYKLGDMNRKLWR